MVRVSGTHEDSEMPIGLQKHGATYRLRRRVPKDLVEAYGRAEVVRSLGTKNLAEAKRRLAIETVKLDAEWDLMRASLTKPSTPIPAQPSPSRLRRLRDGRPAPTGILNVVTELALAARAQRPVEEGGTSNPSAAPNANSGTGRRSGTLTWPMLVDRWAAERRPNGKTKRAHMSVVSEFMAKAHVSSVVATTKADVLNFKEALVKEGVSFSNLRTKLSRLKTIANYAVENDLIGTRITEGVRAPKPKGKARTSFDEEALKKLFNGPVHKDGWRPVQGRGEAAYWLPLIALYTGARLEEIAGLLVSDLTELDYPNGEGNGRGWFFRFLPDHDRNRSLKNDESERTVPVHPELLRLGLIDYRRLVAASGEAQLFPLLTAHASGRRAHKWGQWFSSYLRNECGIADKRIVFHSFRHSLKDAARECGVPEELQRAIMGHAQEGVAGGYGMGFTRHKLVEGMNAVRVSGMPNLQPGQSPKSE